MEAVFRDDAYARSCQATVTAVGERGIALDRTVFYPTGGGQPGDTGMLRWEGGETRIVETAKGDGPDEVLHIPEPGAALPPRGAEVTAEIDWERRYRLMRAHTCLHLLCAVVPGAVTGGSVGEAKGRLDFDLPEPTLDKERIEAALNGLVADDRPVRASWISDAELAAQPDLVRTMSVTPPAGQGRVRVLSVEGADLQPCGGTHVRATGEIGPVRLGKIEKKGRQNRRINVVLEP